MPATTNAHALTKCDFRGHAEGDFDFCAFLKRNFGEEKDSAGTHVLGEAKAFDGGSDLPERKRKQVREPLSGAAFNPNWRSGHRHIILCRDPGSVGATLAQGGRREKLQVSNSKKKIPKLVIWLYLCVQEERRIGEPIDRSVENFACETAPEFVKIVPRFRLTLY
jgi:hypothetical protein